MIMQLLSIWGRQSALIWITVGLCTIAYVHGGPPALFEPDYAPDQVDALRFGDPTPKYLPHSLWVLDDYEWRQGGIQPAMMLSPAELAGMVPEQSGIQFAGCPNCDGGAQENKVLRWRPGLGNRVECQYCKMIFPNERFPNNHEQSVPSTANKQQIYRWYQSKDGREFYFEGRAYFDRILWCQNMANRLANLYALTGNRECALRAAAIVGQFARVYPHYVIKYDQPFKPKRFFPGDRKHPYDELPTWNMGRIYHYAYCDIPDVLAMAYDLVRPSGAFQELAPLLGNDIEQRIKDDLLRLSYEFTAVRPDDYSNMSPTMYHDMVVVGRILNEPAMVHESLIRLRKLMRINFYADGWWKEASPSYHTQVVKSLDDIVRVSHGYSDPESYTPSAGEAGYRELDVQKLIPTIALARQARAEGVLPDGREIPFNDTWSDWYVEPLQQATNRLWPSMGHGILGAGEGADAFQAHLHWPGNHGHAHLDKASLILYAQGHELLSDIGYTHTRWRNWSVNTASHNTVVIDQRSQIMGNAQQSARGNLLWFDSDGSHVGIMDLDAQPAYPDCQEYRRRLIHVHAAQGRDYVVDVFYVNGGQTHDWFLHGEANEQGELATSLTLPRTVTSLLPEWGKAGEYHGESDMDLVGKERHAYGFLRDIRMADLSAEMTAPLYVTWRYSGAGLRTHLDPHSAKEIYRFRAPAIRGAERNDPKLDQFWRNGIMLRNSGGASRFTAVHEPFGAAPWIESVRFEQDSVKVKHPLGEDTISLEPERYQVTSTAGYGYRVAERKGEVRTLDTDAEATCLQLDADPGNARAIRLIYGNGRSDTFQIARREGNKVWLTYNAEIRYDREKQQLQFMSFPSGTVRGVVRYVCFSDLKS